MNARSAAVDPEPVRGADFPAPPPAAARRYALREAEDAATRDALERFIAERYASAYGARIRSFLPRLFALHGERDRRLAAFGLRDAGAAPLFLETYLDAPIEAVIGTQRQTSVARHEIAEIGNLAGRHPGALRVLIPMLGEWLQQAGYRWLVFTGNARLVNGFDRLGIRLTALAPARIERLAPEARADWGRYYESAPVVLCGDIAAGRSHLAAHPELLRGLLPPTVGEEPA